jgi:hypothetical protein
MLLNGSDPLADIAIQNGFADQSHFPKTFRRVTGAIPANCRRIQRGRGPIIRQPTGLTSGSVARKAPRVTPFVRANRVIVEKAAASPKRVGPEC